MMGIKRITIAQHERGLVFRNRTFETVLEPGVHWLIDPCRSTTSRCRSSSTRASTSS
jgi:hypothetical protein